MSSRSRLVAKLAARAAAAAAKENGAAYTSTTGVAAARAGGASATSSSSSSSTLLLRRSQSTLANSGPGKSSIPSPKVPAGSRGTAASAMPAVQQEMVEEALNSAASSSSSSLTTATFLPFARAAPITAIQTNVVGAVSPDDGLPAATTYRNEDGARIDDGRYRAFLEEVGQFVPSERVFQDPLRTFAYSTDASFYRLVPKAVIKITSEAEVARILPIAKKLDVPITFRAAGTSLSGQAITDSVLLKLSHTGKAFRNHEVHGDGSRVTVEPGLIGGEVNAILARHAKKNKLPVQYKIGPDPSSIDSCMVGGIVSNNSSGMCCGVSQNTYHTLADLRAVFADGTVLDTADPASVAAFEETHAELLKGVSDLARRVQADAQLSALIRRKFAIKCTTGYSLNALVDFPADRPVEIVKRLLVGSEGTLAFVSRATYNTVPEWPHKASAFVMFPDVHSACRAASVLRDQTAVDAVEMFDRASLTQCERDETMASLVPDMKGAAPAAAALLIECRGESEDSLEQRIAEVHRALNGAGLPFGPTPQNKKGLDAYSFTTDASTCKTYWDVRKGLIPIVGGAREPGTSMLIEDVACPVDRLADMTVDLAEMFERHGYKEASCFGHALEGNLHLVFAQGFRTPEEVQRFSDMMEEMCWIVATKHSGSLKGEHGTGRNVAPFVEMEWGQKAYQLMWELKELFDPDYVLNPGVILNKDPDVHVKNLKPSPLASPLVDRCIECGFCESNCPSRDAALTPRQRITSYREIARLRAKGEGQFGPAGGARTPEEDQRLRDLEAAFEYQGKEMCAADGMCQEKCPVKINTGELIKSLRAEDVSDKHPRAAAMAMSLSQRMSIVTSIVPPFLNLVDTARKVLGPSALASISSTLNKLSGRAIPTWNEFMPRGAKPLPKLPSEGAPSSSSSSTVDSKRKKVVYLPSCVTRMMGPAGTDPVAASISSTPDALVSLCDKAGVDVVYPSNINSLCCGMMFGSKGFNEAAADSCSRVERALMEASDGGRHPIVCDTSPCLSTLKEKLSSGPLKFALYEPAGFVRHFLEDKLEFEPVRDKVAVHVPCSSKKMGATSDVERLAGRAAKEVVPSGVPCCGMAGDRGMRYPELTGGALQHLETSGCKDGVSTSRTCEMSLSNHSGIHFRGLLTLLDEAAKPKASKKAAAAKSR